MRHRPHPRNFSQRPRQLPLSCHKATARQQNETFLAREESFSHHHREFTIYFFITPDENNPGMTYVTWLTEEGGISRVYDSLDFSWHDTIPLSQSNVLKTNGEVDHAVLLHKTDRSLPPNAATFTPASLSPAEAAIYQRLTAAHPQIVAELNGPNGLQTSQTGSVTGNPADTNFYRIIGLRLDSDGDSLPDLLEMTLGGVNPYDPDTDSNGVTDPWSLGNFTGPIISEFMATNDNTLFDEDGNDSDWIEIYNPTNATHNLSGWQLSDNGNTWTFPTAPTLDPSEQLILAPGETLIIFATKDLSRTNPAAQLHADFGLSSSGDSITLKKPDSPGFIVVDQHTFGPQRKNTSGGWGYDPDDPDFPGGSSFSKNRYFVDATPGVPNPPSTCPGLSTAPTIRFYEDLPSGLLAEGLLFPRSYGSVTVKIIPPDSLPTTQVYYSLDGSDPNSQSILYTGPFQISDTSVVRAIAFQAGCDPSPISARSFLTTDSILGTAPVGQEPTDHQQRPANWPSHAVDIPSQESDRRIIGDLDFAIDPLVVAADYQKIEQELFAHPVISISGSLGKLFGLDAGVYANSGVTNGLDDPLGNEWRRLISVEYYDPVDASSLRQENAEITITGGTSREFTATSKHSLRLRFRSRFSREGNGSWILKNSPFFQNGVKDFKELLLRNPTHDTWLLKWNVNTPRGATYIRGGWLQRLHGEMGSFATGTPHLEAHRRWVHVFLNGLYWGAYELSERVDEDFAKSYLNQDDEFDVFKFSGNTDDDTDNNGDGSPDMSLEERANLTAGDYKAWSVLRNHCLAAAGDPDNPNDEGNPNDPAAWQAVLNYLDLDNYLDYLLVQMYSNVRDWPDKNFRVLRRRGLNENLVGNPTTNPGGKFQFLVWDAEASLNPNNPPNEDQVFAKTGVAEFHGILLGHPLYRQAFQDRIDLHFNDPGGILTPVAGGGLSPGYQLFQTEMDRFGGIRDSSGNLLTPGVLTAESARWGDGNPDLTLSLGYQDTPEYGPGWKTRAERIRDDYDDDRRQEFLDAIDGILTPPVNP